MKDILECMDHPIIGGSHEQEERGCPKTRVAPSAASKSSKILIVESDPVQPRGRCGRCAPCSVTPADEAATVGGRDGLSSIRAKPKSLLLGMMLPTAAAFQNPQAGAGSASCRSRFAVLFSSARSTRLCLDEVNQLRGGWACFWRPLNIPSVAVLVGGWRIISPKKVRTQNEKAGEGNPSPLFFCARMDWMISSRFVPGGKADDVLDFGQIGDSAGQIRRRLGRKLVRRGCGLISLFELARAITRAARAVHGDLFVPAEVEDVADRFGGVHQLD